MSLPPAEAAWTQIFEATGRPKILQGLLFLTGLGLLFGPYILLLPVVIEREEARA